MTQDPSHPSVHAHIHPHDYPFIQQIVTVHSGSDLGIDLTYSQRGERWKGASERQPIDALEGKVGEPGSPSTEEST